MKGVIKFDFEGLGRGTGYWGLTPSTPHKKDLFSEFEVKRQNFLIFEVLALCLIIYQILIVPMAWS